MKSFLLISAGVVYGIVALLLLGAVLLQESKGGGLAALGGTRAEGAFGASNPLRRLTVGLSIIFFLLASALSLALAPEGSVTEDVETPPAAGGEENGDKGEKGEKGVVAEVDIKDGDKKPAKDEKDAKDEKKPAPEAPRKDDAKGEAEPGEKAPAGKPAGKPEEKPAAG